MAFSKQFKDLQPDLRLYLLGIHNDILLEDLPYGKEYLGKLNDAGLIKRNSDGKIVPTFSIIRGEDAPIEMGEEELKEFVQAYRLMFTKAIKPDKGSLMKTMQNMRWFLGATEFGAEEILEATHNYIEYCVYHNEYNMNPPNFIHKHETRGKKKIENSLLGEWCYRLQEAPPTRYVNDL